MTWGLRDYKLKPMVWGGDETHRHDFTGAIVADVRLPETVAGKTRTTERFYGEESRKFDGNHQKHYSTQTCACGAWLGSLGLEPTPELYVQHIVEIFREVRRVLRKDGTVWLNMGFSYDGRGNLVDQPTMVRDALVRDGWYCKAPIVWHKSNPMPSSQEKRPTIAHEMLWLLAKDKGTGYYYDQDAVREPLSSDPRSWGRHTKKDPGTAAPNPRPIFGPGRNDRDGTEWGNGSTRNLRSVWTISTQPFAEAHFATFPEKLVEPCIKAGTSEKGCCAKCGAPWERILETTRTFESGSGRSGIMPLGKNGPNLQGGGATLDVRRGPVTHTRTIGRRRTCSCDAGNPVPCLVFDPFAGSGTVGVVALALGRRFVGLDLQPDYCQLAVKRIEDDAPLLNRRR